MTKIILGGGIAGMLASEFYPNAVIIDQAFKSAKISPRYMYNHKYNRYLCDRLALDPAVKTINYGFEHDGKLVDPSLSLLKQYHQYVRGTEPDQAWLDAHASGEVSVLDIDFDTILSKLHARHKHMSVEDEIIGIDPHRKMVFCEHECHEYTSLISTLPYPTFARLVDDGTSGAMALPLDDFASVPITLGVHQSLTKESLYDSKYNYVYRLCQPHRVVRFEEPLVIGEHIGDVGGIDVVHRMRHGKIISGEVPDLTSRNIKLLGRFGQWRQSMKAHDVISELIRDDGFIYA